MLSAVDYVLTFLITEPFKLIDRMVAMFVRSPERQAFLRRRLTLLLNFLKNRYDDHIGSNHEPQHDLNHGLIPGASRGAAAALPCKVMCSACKFPSYVFDLLRKEIKEAPDTAGGGDGDEALQVLDHAYEKTRIFQGHRMRVVNQQQAIDRHHKDMEKECVRLGRLGKPCDLAHLL